MAALTMVASYLWVTPAAGFLSTAPSNSVDNGMAHNTLRRITPFGVQHTGGDPRGSFTRLYMAPASGAGDKEEWRAMLAAFQLYKAAYGDLKIPTRFVVPSMAPWPEAAWGMPLGKKVSQIRSEGKYVENNEKRRQQLEKLGFIWRLRSEAKSAEGKAEISFDQIYEALKVYRDEVQPTGPLDVPSEYTVPDSQPWPEHLRGLPLGRSVQTVRSKSFLKANPGAEEKLKAIGFQLSTKMAANDIRFQNVYIALKCYKEIYGDLLVPQPFEVPSDSPDWPKATWGLRLGARVNAIRSQGTFVKTNPERRELLDEIGFVWTQPENEKRKRGRRSKAEIEAEDAKRAQEAEKAAATKTTEDFDDDDLDSFVASFDFSGTDSSEAAPEEDSISPTWGFETGSEFQDLIASAQGEASKHSSQEEYSPPQTLEESLADAKRRAIEVGIIKEGEGKTLVKGKREKDIPWFNDDFGGDFVFEDVVEALTLYKSFYGDFSNFTNEDFVIPFQGEAPDPFDLDFDEDDLDMMENDPSARAAAAIARFDEFDDFDMTEEKIEAEISRLEQEVLEPEEMQEAAVATLTPVKEVEWPEHLAGMKLGNIVARIRDGSLEVKHLPERKKQLDDIDFDWGDPKYFIDIPFEKAMCAMYAYYLVRGDMFVPSDFVMPDEDPWPRALAGYEVGQAVKRLRELQNFMEAYHSEKVSLLRMIDFIWFPTLALPIDPNEPEMTPEMLKLSAFGHPDYAKMIDIPMGLPDKIIADGPFFESDDPKLWWRKWHNWDYVADYWYENGRRDNAFVLRGMGYPQMADEHEEKYGPGLFTQIEETLDILESGNKIESAAEKEDLLEKLKYFRGELNGCTDTNPQIIEKLVEEIDVHMLQLVTGKKGGSVEEQFEAAAMAYEEEEVEEEYEDYVEEGINGSSDDEYEYEEYEEDYDEEFDVEAELGLDSSEEEQEA